VIHIHLMIDPQSFAVVPAALPEVLSAEAPAAPTAEAMMASAPPGGGGLLRRIITQAIVRRTGASHEDVDRALTVAEGERPILDWLKDGGLETLIKIVLSIIAMFALQPPMAGGIGDFRITLIRDLLVRAAASKLGIDREVIEKALSVIETEKPIIEWLKVGGLAAVFAVIEAVIDTL
jgi:hypothetical protein